MNRIILVLAVVLGMSFTASAQKTGFVNTQELLSQMPEYKEAQTSFENYYKELEAQFTSMQQEYMTKVQDYDQKQATWSEVVRETKAREIHDIEKRLQEFQQGIEERIDRKQAEVLSPILEKVQNAIDAVGKEEGFDYIYDAGGLLYAKDALNINNKIKVKLGIK